MRAHSSQIIYSSWRGLQKPHIGRRVWLTSTAEKYFHRPQGRRGTVDAFGPYGLVQVVWDDSEWPESWNIAHLNWHMKARIK
jgi:hypothetical protein